MSGGKYTIGYTELYWDYKHGKTELSSKYIEYNHIVIYELTNRDFYDNELLSELQKNITESNVHSWLGYCMECKRLLKRKDDIKPKNKSANLTVKNLEDNLKDVNKIQKHYAKYFNNNINIIEIKELDGGEQVAIIKTFWLKILQKNIKNIINIIKIISDFV